MQEQLKKESSLETITSTQSIPCSTNEETGTICPANSPLTLE